MRIDFKIIPVDVSAAIRDFIDSYDLRHFSWHDYNLTMSLEKIKRNAESVRSSTDTSTVRKQDDNTTTVR